MSATQAPQESDFDLPDSLTELEGRIQYLEWVADNCSRETYADAREELRAAREKRDDLKRARLIAGSGHDHP